MRNNIYHWLSWFFLLCIVAMSLAITAPVALGEDPPVSNDDNIVWRGDLLSPDDMIRQGGFLPRGMDGTRPNQPPPDISLYNHVNGSPTGMARYTSGFVATSFDRNAALRFIAEALGGNGYLYRIHASPNFIDAAGTLRQWYRYSDEQEYAALGGIRMDQVLGWTRVSFGQAARERRNARYNAAQFDRLTVGGAQPQLAGFPENHPAWNQYPWNQFSICGSRPSLKRLAETDSCHPLLSAESAGEDYMNSIGMEWNADIPRAILPNPKSAYEAYFFNADRYLLSTIESPPAGDKTVLGPKTITEEWPSLKQANFSTVDAALINPSNRDEAYFFSGTQYVLLEINPGSNQDQLILGPKNIANEWPSLRQAKFNTIDAVLPNPGNADEAYFFSGNQYVLVKIKPGTHDDSLVLGPKTIDDEWASLKQAGFDHVDAALLNPSNTSQAYFFCDDQYVLVDVNPGTHDDKIIVGPAKVADDWTPLREANFY